MLYVIKIICIIVYCIVVVLFWLTLGPLVVLYSGWNGWTEVWDQVWADMGRLTRYKVTDTKSMIKFLWHG